MVIYWALILGVAILNIESTWIPRAARDSKFLLNLENDPELLVVLCHGWHGHLTRTWGDFEAIYQEFQDLQVADVLFLGYRKSPTAIDLLASFFADALRDVFPDYSHVGGEVTRSYSKLLLIGHSMGSLAIRRALVQMNKRRDKCDSCRLICESTELLLFACPQKGVDWEIYTNAVEGFTPWKGLRGLLAAVRKVKEPVSDDLAVDSAFLKKLRFETEEILKSESPFPKAELILGMEDRVIEANDLDDYPYLDDDCEVWPGHDHTTLCKVKYPDHAQQPLQLFMQKIREQGASG